MLRKSTHILNISPATSGLLVAFLLLLISCAVTWLGYENFKRGEERELEAITGQMKQDIHDFMNKSYNAAFALTHAISPSGQTDNFNTSARFIASRHPYILMMSIVQSDTIRLVYPMEGNEGLIGQNILSGERLRYEMGEIVKQKEIHFSGPIKFRRGPMIVGSLPITSGDKIWGLAIIVVELESFFELIKLYQYKDRGYQIQFSKINPITLEVEEFLDTKMNLNLATVLEFEIDEGDWRLQIAKPYYFENLIGLLLLAFFSMAFALVCGVFVKNILEKPFLLEQMVQEKSGLLLASEQRNRAILAALPDTLLILNRRGEVLNYHIPSNNTGIKPTEQFYSNFINLENPEIKKIALDKITKVLIGSSLEIQEYRLLDQYFEARFVKNNDNEVLVIVRNITDKVLQVQAIEAQNAQLQDIAWMQSHEMRAPLARIMAIIHWLELAKENSRDEHMEMLSHIINSAYEMDKLIADITHKSKEVTVGRD